MNSDRSAGSVELPDALRLRASYVDDHAVLRDVSEVPVDSLDVAGEVEQLVSIGVA